VKRALSRFVLIVVVGLACLWGWRILFPSPEQIIRKKLTALAHAASRPANESMVAEALKLDQLPGFFAPDVQIDINVTGHHLAITGRDEIIATAAMAAKSQPGGFKVEFGGFNINVAADHMSALVQLTATVKVPGERDEIPQELKFAFQKIDGT
jgi:hypothetical protein